MITFFWIALALGIATTVMGYVSSASRWEAFIGSLQYGVVYTISHAIFTTAIFSVLFYAALAIGRWAIG